jgi:uncharacterized protein YoxC
MSEQSIMIIIAALFSLGTGVIGYLLANNKTLASTAKTLRGLAFAMIMQVLAHDPDKIDPKLRELAMKSADELEKTF